VLAFAVGVIGTILLRFAFYKPRRKSGAAPGNVAEISVRDGAGNDSTPLQFVALRRRG
jgi:hypothetical protein